MGISHQILCALRDLCNKWIAGLDVTVVNPPSNPVNVDFADLIAALDVLNTNVSNNTSVIQTTLQNIPQLEGLGLTPWCDDTTGAVTGWSSVIIPDENNPTATQTLFFDAALNPAAAAPINSSPCASDEEPLYMLQGCDDVTGEPAIKFVDGAGTIVNTILPSSIGLGDCVCPNRPPALVMPIPDLFSPRNVALSIDYSVYFSDPDGDAMTFSTIGSPGPLPVGLVLDPNTGIVSGTPVFLGQPTLFAITMTADDGNGGTVSDSFDWTTG